jgi:hypothetical protein
MDAKTIHNLVFLAVLSLFCSGFAWAVDHVVFSAVFAAVGSVAAFGVAAPRSRH